jgi:hypothetical protein
LQILFTCEREHGNGYLLKHGAESKNKK